MMKRAGIAAGAALIVALLAGCSAPAVDEPIESAKPLVAEAPTPTAADEGESTYLSAVREALPSDTVIPDATDDQLLDAGREACERMAAGEDGNAMSVIEGEEPNGLGNFEDSGAIVRSAHEHLC